MPEPKLHHYLPQWYLRRFSDERGRIRVYRRGSGLPPHTTSVKKVGAENYFNRVAVPQGSDPLAIEKFLSVVEGAGKDAVERIIRGPFPPDPLVRRNFAHFLGFQLLRTPEQRRWTELSTDALLKVHLKTLSSEGIRDSLREAGLDSDGAAVDRMTEWVANIDSWELRPDQNEHLRLMLDLAIGTGNKLLERSWLLGLSEKDLVTSDHPLVGFSIDREGVWSGLGLDVAEMFAFPLDSSRVLMFAAPELRFEEARYDVLDPLRDRLNLIQATSSYREIYQNPGCHRIDPMIPTDVRDLSRDREKIRALVEELMMRRPFAP